MRFAKARCSLRSIFAVKFVRWCGAVAECWHPPGDSDKGRAAAAVKSKRTVQQKILSLLAPLCFDALLEHASPDVRTIADYRIDQNCLRGN